MTYPYGTKGAPVVGNGLGGLPRRAVAAAPSVVTPTIEPSYSLFAQGNANWVRIYRPEQLGNGTQSNISGLSQATRSVDISPNGKFFAVGLAASPFIAVYSANNGVFTRLADPAVLPTAAGWEVRFFANNRFLVSGQGAAVLSYQISDNVVTRVEQVDGLSSSGVSSKNTFAFSSNFQIGAILTNTSPFVRCYTQANGSFTALDPVDVSLPAAARWVTLSGDGVYMAIGLNGSPFLSIYKRVGNRFEKLADPSSMPTAAGDVGAFAPDASGFFEDNGNQGTTFYSRSGDVFTRGSALSGGSRPSSVYGLVYTKDGRFLVRVGSFSAASSGLWRVSGTTYTFDSTNPLPGDETFFGFATYKPD